jgi:hypothetical protein
MSCCGLNGPGDFSLQNASTMAKIWNANRLTCTTLGVCFSNSGGIQSPPALSNLGDAISNGTLVQTLLPSSGNVSNITLTQTVLPSLGGVINGTLNQTVLPGMVGDVGNGTLAQPTAIPLVNLVGVVSTPVQPTVLPNLGNVINNTLGLVQPPVLLPVACCPMNNYVLVNATCPLTMASSFTSGCASLVVPPLTNALQTYSDILLGLTFGLSGFCVRSE